MGFVSLKVMMLNWVLLALNLQSKTFLTAFRFPSVSIRRQSINSSRWRNSGGPRYLSSYTVLNDNESKTIQSRDVQTVLQTAERAARAAGEIMLRTNGQIAISKTKMNIADLVTESDVECQRLIQECILEDWPQDGFLGEEDVVGTGTNASVGALRDALDTSEGKELEDNKTWVWIVDPIDGTTNFCSGE